MSQALGKWHQGQRTAYLPNKRGFDEFLGLPASVDDAQGYLSPCNGSRLGGASRAAAGVGLGPLLPLPLIRQASSPHTVALYRTAAARLAAPATGPPPPTRLVCAAARQRVGDRRAADGPHAAHR